MRKTTSGKTALAMLSLGTVPFTTVVAGSVTEPKIPALVGDSWRPAAAGLLGAVPLAVTVAMTGAAMMGPTAAAWTHTGAAAAQICVTAVPGTPGTLKLPACLGD